MSNLNQEVFDSAQFGALVEYAAIGVLVADINEKIYYANAAALKLLGYSREQMLAANMAEIVHPDQVAEMRLIRDGRLKVSGADSYHRESKYLTRDGQSIWVQAHVGQIGIKSAAGEPLYSIHLSPIDRQKRAELELSKTQQRFEFALSSAQQGVWDYDYAAGTGYHSDVWHRIRGLEPGCGKRVELEDWLACIHPDDRDRVRDYVALQNSGELDQIAYEFRERHEIDGRWIWILSRGGVAERNEAGLPIRIVGTDTDITPLKQSEEKTAHMAHRLELARSISVTGIWEVEMETGRTFWDEAVRELFGIGGASGEVPDDQWEKGVHPDDRDRATAEIDHVLKTRADHYSQYRIVRPDGEVRYIRSRAVVHDDRMSPPRIIGVNWDVTSDVRLTEQLQRANQLAEQRNEELQTANSIVEFNALHDSLTGLPNRRFLDEQLAKLAEQCSRNGERLAVLHFDLDRFKQINDTLGHAAGDAMLMHAAEVLKQSVREGDFVARVGGDEFVVLLSRHVSESRLEHLSMQVLDIMAQPIQFQGNQSRTGVSIGVATAQGQDIDPGLLLINADIALYRAKSKGRNRFEHFTEALQDEITAAKTCADEIHTGLENDEFMAFYQPQFDAQSLEIVGVEALARWQHPKKGVLPPIAFLKTAEDINVVSAIDRLILEKAIKARQHWLDAGEFIPRLSVNVSTKRLREDDLASGLRELNVEPGVVSFELLESIFLDEDDDDFIAWQIEQLHELGIDIDIDDFGTGHASIVGLLRLKPQRLKIARELVAPIVESEPQRELVRSIIEIGQSLNIGVVAEGVETMAHADILAAMGCDILQGYAFGRPMAEDDFLRFAQARGWKAVS